MTIDHVVDGETELDSALFNPWVDHMNGLQTGALPIALAGIEGALGEWAPGGPTRSQSLRGRATTPYWSASEAILLEDFGGRGDNSYDNTSVLPDAIAEATAQGVSGRKGAPIRLLRGIYLISQPIVLPRTGSTPTNVVHLLGSNIRSTILAGTSAFPANRAMIEWETTTARTWHPRISGMTIRLPSVVGTKAIWYKRNGPRPATSYAEYSDERLGAMVLSDLLIEASNRYHETLIDLEGSVFYSTFLNLIGDPSRTDIGNDYDGPYSTLLLRGDYGYNTGQLDAPFSTIDAPGFWNCLFDGIYGMMRRGGYSRTFEGRLATSIFQRSFANGGLPGSVSYWFRNCSSSTIHAIGTEGYADLGVRVDSGHLVQINDVRLGSPDAVYPVWQANTAHAAGVKVVPTSYKGGTYNASRGHYYQSGGGTSGGSEPTWPTTSGGTVSDGTITWTEQGFALASGLEIHDSADVIVQRRLTAANTVAHSLRGEKTLVIGSGSYRTRVEQFLVRKRSGGGITDEYTDGGTDSVIDVVEATTIGTIGGGDFG